MRRKPQKMEIRKRRILVKFFKKESDIIDSYSSDSIVK